MVFAELAARFGAHFAREWPNGLAEVKPVWERDLSRLTEQELRRGMAMLKRETWAPHLNRFLAMCRPPVDFEAAFADAQHQMGLRDQGRDVWAHPAVYWAAIRYGAFDLRQHGWQVAKAKWTRLLTDAMTEKLEPVPQRMLALPDVGKATTDKETARAKLAELSKLLKSKVVN